MRELIIWGTGKKADELTDKITCWNEFSCKMGQGKIFDIQYYLDSAKKEEEPAFRQKSVKLPDEVEWHLKKEITLIVVAVVRNEEIVEYLECKGCMYQTDYIFYKDINKYLYGEQSFIKALFGTDKISSVKLDDIDESELTQYITAAIRSVDNRCSNKDAYEYLDLMHETILVLADKYVHREDSKKSIGALYIKTLGPARYTLMLSKVFSYDIVSGSEWMPRRKVSHGKTVPRVIGIYEHRMFSGGTERVVSQLIPILMERGYKIILFTDEVDKEKEYSLPDDLVRICLGKDRTNLHRYELIEKAIKQYDIDIYCCHMYIGYTLYDLFFVNRMGVPIVLEYHQNFIINAYDGNFPLSMTICKFVDVLVTLSEMDALFWKLLGCRSMYIPNPVEEPEREIHEPVANTILWIQRIVPFQKQCFDLPEILEQVVALVPEAKLQIAGMPDNPKVEEKLRQMFAEKALLGNVEFLGYHKDVSNLYRQAEVLLMTSAFEGFPMVVVESKKYGVPLVMYELPYLELLRDGRGYIAVAQSDKSAAAREIAHLLKDHSMRKKLSMEAKDSLADFINMDLATKWQQAFELAIAGTENTLTESEKRFAEIEKLIIKTYENVKLAGRMLNEVF